jgi:glycine hydroxymethyltransferase
MFGCNYVNVQPHSGASANMAVYFALLSPGDTILGPRLDHGGHLTHGSPVNFSGKFYNFVAYGVHSETHRWDEEEIRKLAHQHKPKLIVSGASAYPRQINWKVFKEIADEVGAMTMSDVAHYAGLIVGGAYENPFPYIDVVTSTTHKTLRGPRGGIIMTNNEAQYKAINKTVFPGIQGGPLMHQIAGKAVAFKEALQPEFKVYAKAVVDNAQAMAKTLIDQGFDLLSGGTDSHLMVIDLRSQGLSGAEVETALGKTGITVNKNAVPNDPNPPKITSGVRVGTAAITTRGFDQNDCRQVANLITEAVKYRADDSKLAILREQVRELCKKRPLFPHRLK